MIAFSVSVVTGSPKSYPTTTAQPTSNKNPYSSLVATLRTSTKHIVSSDDIKPTNNEREFHKQGAITISIETRRDAARKRLRIQQGRKNAHAAIVFRKVSRLYPTITECIMQGRYKNENKRHQLLHLRATAPSTSTTFIQTRTQPHVDATHARPYSHILPPSIQNAMRGTRYQGNKSPQKQKRSNGRSLGIEVLCGGSEVWTGMTSCAAPVWRGRSR